MARKIIVRRTITRLVADKAIFGVYVDGERVFAIANGKADQVVVSDEEHSIQVVNETSLDKETGEFIKTTQYTDPMTIPAGTEDVDFLMELKPLSRRTLQLKRIK